tara:strand:- start:60 stop:407 length:348 start_codon:yes stop_codon:yes gene_type:complete
MTKIVSLKKGEHFRRVLKERKVNTSFYTLFASKNIKKTDNSKTLNISFVMKKKIGNAVKRNKIRRKLKGIVLKLTKINSAINYNYTYIVFGKSNAYIEKHNVLMQAMISSFKKIK